MALSSSEQRRLADIDRQLSAEDPRLAGMITAWSVGPSRRRRSWKLMVGAVVSVGVLLAGIALIGAQVEIVLVMSGVLGFLAALTVCARLLRPRWRQAANRNPETEGAWRPRTGADRWYLWSSCWCWWG